MLKTVVLLILWWILWWIERIYLKLKSFFTDITVFTLSFEQFNAYLENKYYYFYWTLIFEHSYMTQITINPTRCPKKSFSFNFWTLHKL